MTAKLIFDGDGFCVGRVSGPDAAGYDIPAGKGALPLAAFYLLNGEVRTGTPVQETRTMAAPGDAQPVVVPANTKAIFGGQSVVGPATLNVVTDFADITTVVFKGAKYGELVFEFETYAEKRRKEYPAIPDQLDMIYHDIDNWRATIAAIKAKYPAPGE